jgi:DnaJ-class molecular chaperone
VRSVLLVTPYSKVIVEVECEPCEGSGYRKNGGGDEPCYMCDGSGKRYRENVADVWRKDVYVESIYANVHP